jgi:hypothetical protein
MTISKISRGTSSSFMMSQFLVGGVEDTHDLFGGFVDLSEVIGGRSPNFGPFAPEILPL